MQYFFDNLIHYQLGTLYLVGGLLGAYEFKDSHLLLFRFALLDLLLFLIACMILGHNVCGDLSNAEFLLNLIVLNA